MFLLLNLSIVFQLLNQFHHDPLHILLFEIDQAKFRWLEFYKVKFDGSLYTRLLGKFVLKAQTDFGFLGTYNKNIGNIPFERFFLGGDGMMQYALDGRETIALRGYENQSLSSRDGSIIYNKFSLELRLSPIHI